MFVFTKGKLKTFNPIKDRVNVSEGRDVHGIGRKSDGSFRKVRSCAGNIISKYGVRWNYWLMYNQKRGIETRHPAIFPEKLANDPILSWSNEGDTVLDPFMGSGTVAKMSKLLNRHYIGFEISQEYCDIAEERLGK
jgi:site-specific DNA-methyltransferase (adenine-specific)